MMKLLSNLGLVSILLSFCVLRSTAQETSGNPVKDKEQVVYVLPFVGEVELGLVQVFRRGFEAAKQAEADHIIIETNTPGGRVDAALEIIDLIMDTKIPVYIYVTGDATSAGAIISIAADGIYMQPSTTIGTAAPVLMGGGGGNETVNEKVLSYLLAKVRSLCEEKGYSEEKTEIFLAMIDSSKKIPDPDDPEEFITTEGSLLTLTNNEALQYGIADGIHETREDLLKTLQLEHARIVTVSESDFERIARFFSSISISGLLITIAVIGLYLEFQTPGFGIPGLVGVIALALFFWGHLLGGLTGYEGVLLFGIGVILVGLELFIIPGFGFTGFLGVICMLTSIVITLLDRPITSPHFWETFDWATFYQATFVTLVSTLAGILMVLSLPFFLPAAFQTSAGSWLMLKDTQDRKKGYHSSQDGLEAMLGKEGVTKSTLRPAGIATIDGVRMDVVSQGGFIPKNTNIKVVKVEGRRVVVKQV